MNFILVLAAAATSAPVAARPSSNGLTAHALITSTSPVAATADAPFAVHPAFHAAYRALAAAYRVVRVNGKFQSR